MRPSLHGVGSRLCGGKPQPSLAWHPVPRSVPEPVLENIPGGLVNSLPLPLAMRSLHLFLACPFLAFPLPCCLFSLCLVLNPHTDIWLSLLLLLFGDHHCCWCFTVFCFFTKRQPWNSRTTYPSPKNLIRRVFSYQKPCALSCLGKNGQGTGHHLTDHTPSPCQQLVVHNWEGLDSLQPFPLHLEARDKLFGVNILFLKIHPSELDHQKKRKSQR